MNSIDFDIVKNLINQKKFSTITEYAQIRHEDKGKLVVCEYAGSGVRISKDIKGNTRIFCPKDITPIQEGHVAQAIANGSIFDDAEEIDNNAEMIEKTSIPCNAMINSGKCPPKHLKPMIALVISKMDDDGSFDIGDSERTNGVNLIKDLVKVHDTKQNVNDVFDNYLEKDPKEFYGVELGKEILEICKEVDEICNTNPDDCITDDDCCDSYDGIDIEELEKEPSDSDEECSDCDDEECDECIKESDESVAEEPAGETAPEAPESGESGGEEAAVEEAAEPTEATTPSGSVNVNPMLPSAQTKASLPLSKQPCNTSSGCGSKVSQEGFLFNKKPKKLKPIPRDIIAYITCEMNDIHSANDQAMLSGYTCSKIELVDFYLTVLDTDDARYIVPHNRQYLSMMKQELEKLLTQILRIRPINRSEQIWRVNYPTS